MDRPLRVLDCFGTVVFTDKGRPDHRKMTTSFADLTGCDVTLAKKFVYPLVAHAWLPHTPSMDVAGRVHDSAGVLGIPEALILDFLWNTVGPGASTWVVPQTTRGALAAMVADGYELRLLTNTALTPGQLDDALTHVGLRSYFTLVMASSSGKGKKPEIAWLKRAFADGGNDIAMVGDHEVFDLAPARSLGIPTVQISSPADWDCPSPLLRPRRFGQD